MWTLPFLYFSFLAPLIGIFAVGIGLIYYIVALITQTTDTLYLSGALMIAGSIEAYVWYLRVMSPPREWRSSVDEDKLVLLMMGVAVPLYPIWNFMSAVTAGGVHGLTWLHALDEPVISLVAAMLLGSAFIVSSGLRKLPESRYERLQAVSRSVRIFGIVSTVVLVTSVLLLFQKSGIRVNGHWIPMIAIVVISMIAYVFTISKCEHMDEDGIERWGSAERFGFTISGIMLLAGSIGWYAGVAILSPELETLLRAQPWYREFVSGFLVGSGLIFTMLGAVLCWVFIGKLKTQAH